VQTYDLIQHEPGMFGDPPRRTAKVRLNPSEEEFGEERLRCVLRQVASLPVEEMLGRLTQELDSGCGSVPRSDVYLDEG
jgi:hypothetical protein